MKRAKWDSSLASRWRIMSRWRETSYLNEIDELRNDERRLEMSNKEKCVYTWMSTRDENEEIRANSRCVDLLVQLRMRISTKMNVTSSIQSLFTFQCSRTCNTILFFAISIKSIALIRWKHSRRKLIIHFSNRILCANLIDELKFTNETSKFE